MQREELRFANCNESWVALRIGRAGSVWLHRPGAVARLILRWLGRKRRAFEWFRAANPCLSTCPVGLVMLAWFSANSSVLERFSVKNRHWRQGIELNPHYRSNALKENTKKSCEFHVSQHIGQQSMRLDAKKAGEAPDCSTRPLIGASDRAMVRSVQGRGDLSPSALLPSACSAGDS